MPRVRLIAPWAETYEISTMRPETLSAWFDEILPIVNGRAYAHDMPAGIYVHPMFRPADGVRHPDWLLDSRVIGRVHPFRARNGADGLAELDRLRQELEQELASLRSRI